MPENRDDLVGRLSNFRCPDCGCTLYVNRVGDAWCSNGCGFEGEFDAQRFIKLPPPEKVKEISTRLEVLLGEEGELVTEFEDDLWEKTHATGSGSSADGDSSDG